MKHCIARILISVLLGAATTVAVAWAFAWLNRVQRYNRTLDGFTSDDADGWFVAVYEEPGTRYFDGWSRAGMDQTTSDPTATVALIHPAHLAALPCIYREPHDGRLERFRQDRGWPFLALAAEASDPEWALPDPVDELLWGLRIPLPREGDSLQESVDVRFIALPLRPLPLGFGLDTLIYGSFWFLVLSLRAIAKRKRPTLSNWIVFGVSLTLIVLGSVTTVTVAWLCALSVDETFDRDYVYGTDRYPEWGSGRWHLFRDREPGALRLYADVFVGGGGVQSAPNCKANEICPHWADLLRPPASWLERYPAGRYKHDTYGTPELREMEAWGRRVVDARGWPMLALWSGLIMRDVRPEDRSVVLFEPSKVVHGILIEKRYDGDFRWDWSRLIPLAPIWPGFIVDTLFYGALWGIFALYILGPGIFARTWRMRRGRCPRCAYDLRGALENGCPECGWNRIGEGTKARRHAGTKGAAT